MTATEQDMADRGFPSFARVAYRRGPFPRIEIVLDPTAAELRRIYADLLARQEPLGAEFEAVWADNIAALYDDEPIPQPVQQQAERAARWPLDDERGDGA